MQVLCTQLKVIEHAERVALCRHSQSSTEEESPFVPCTSVTVNRDVQGVESCHPEVKCSTMKGPQQLGQMCTSALLTIDVRLCEPHSGNHMSYLLVRKIVMAYSIQSWALHRGYDPSVKLPLVFSGLCEQHGCAGASSVL